MTDSSDLNALAERCEKEAAGSRELDAAIAIAAGKYVRERRGNDRKDWFYRVGGEDYERRSTNDWGIDGLPRYSESLDAARKLGGMVVFASDIGADGLPMVKLVFDTATSPIIEHTGIAATLELAWCAAALRAIAATE